MTSFITALRIKCFETPVGNSSKQKNSIIDGTLRKTIRNMILSQTINFLSEHYHVFTAEISESSLPLGANYVNTKRYFLRRHVLDVYREFMCFSEDKFASSPRNLT